MTMPAGGLVKLQEECGELVQVCAKKQACMNRADYFDGTSLQARLEEEIADVIAAARFVVRKHGLDEVAIATRIRRKTQFYEAWDAEPTNGG